MPQKSKKQLRLQVDIWKQHWAVLDGISEHLALQLGRIVTPTEAINSLLAHPEALAAYKRQKTL